MTLAEELAAKYHDKLLAEFESGHGLSPMQFYREAINEALDRAMECCAEEMRIQKEGRSIVGWDAADNCRTAIRALKG